MWLGKDQRDLATMGWDNKVKAAKCWFFDARKRRTTPGTDLAKRDGVKDLVPVPPEANPELAKWVVSIPSTSVGGARTANTLQPLSQLTCH